jgi:mono/diheme cytochrome c family protein
LAGADWVTGSKHRLIAILHHGLAGPITVKGNLYNNNMPAWGDGAPVPLKDEQIAAILTYIRNEWGNQADAVTTEEVALIRATSKDRKQPWSEKELLALPSEMPPAPAK